MSFNEYTKKLQHESKIQFYNVPVRSNYTESDCLEVLQDQPIDYSRKYCERKIDNNDVQNSSNTNLNLNEDSFGDYQETDLDQPTDYSLRYGENTSDISDLEKQNSIKEYYQEEPNFAQEDTFKCYYTERAPYDSTLYNFSITTPLPDMRMTQPECEKNKENREDEVRDKVQDKMTASNEKDTCSDYNDAAVKETMKFSSGIGSPEKPVNYCEEGTPGYFSRVSSLSSLDGFNEPQAKYGDNATESEEKSADIPNKGNKGNTKVVSFVPGPDYAQETPLMFSRSSSLGSLSSIEQPDVIDDHNSMVSDFSRLTSGIVSPSELPDSPTQAVQTAKTNDKTTTDINKDHIANYAEEGTPAEFSCVTSLSALTIDDEYDQYDHQAQIFKTKSSNNSIGNEQQLVSEGDEEDEDILAACINIGMQKRHVAMPTHSTPKYHPKVNNDTVRLYCTEDTPATVSKAASNSDLQSLESADEIVVTKEMKPISDVEDILSDSSNSSNENKDLLGECIKYGMLKSSNQMKIAICKPPKQPQSSQNYLVAKDEVAMYAVEDTPCNFSICSSISDLTINSIDKPKPNKQLMCDADITLKQSENDVSHVPLQEAFPSSLHADQPSYYDDLKEKTKLSKEVSHNDYHSSVQDSPSFSSSSVESFDSPDGESNLFEQCIKSGLPKQRTLNANEKRHTVKKHVFSQIPTLKSPRKKSSEESKTVTQKIDEVTDIALLQECIYSGMQKSKPGSSQKLDQQVTEVDCLNKTENKKINIKSSNPCNDMEEQFDTLVISEGQNIRGDVKIPNETDHVFNCKSETKTEKGCPKKTFVTEESHRKLQYAEVFDDLSEADPSDVRLDVQDLQTTSITNNGSEDTCSYETFPSISCTVPNVVNVDPETDDVSLCISTTLDDSYIQPKLNCLLQSGSNNRFNTVSHNMEKAMSNSSIIEFEAIKLATALENSDSMTYSMCLDQIKPPSPMGSMMSLSQSICSNSELEIDQNNAINYNKITKNPLPGSLLVRRALHSYFFNNSDNFDQSLNNTSTYNLDSVKPPSVMNDLDMDNSINSVASITSEIAEFKITNSQLLQQSLLITSCNFSDIEDVNPPSMLSDLTLQEMSSSTVEEKTINHAINRKTLTPKQNRQLSKERYRTYVLQEDKDALTQDKISDDDINDCSENNSKSRKTCKQRRQEDRARFQTQVLDVTSTPESKPAVIDSNTIVKKSNVNEWNLEDNIRVMEGRESNYDLDNLLAHDADLILGRLSNDRTIIIETNPVCNDDIDLLTDSASTCNPPIFNVSDDFKKLNKNSLNTTIDLPSAKSKQSESYIISREVVSDKLEESPHKNNESTLETVKNSLIVNDEMSPRASRPHSKTSYISPYRNMGYRQSLKTGISKPNTVPNKQVEPKTALNLVLNTKPSLPRLNKTIEHKSDASRKSTSNSYLLNRNVVNTSITKYRLDARPQPKPLERQGTFTKEETKEIAGKKLPSPKKRISAIPCKLPKSTESKLLPPSNLRKPGSLRYNIPKSASADSAIKPKTSVIPLKTCIPSKEGSRLMPPSGLKPPTNLKQPSATRLSNVYKKSEESKLNRLSENNYHKLPKSEMDPTASNDWKRIQRSQTFDNRGTNKCVLACGVKQKSSIGIRSPHRYSRI